MARTISQPDSPLNISIVLVGIGAVLGIAHFLVTLVLTRYVIDPLACGVTSSAADCASSLVVADSITTILIATAGIFLLVRYGASRPLLVAATAGLFMWGVMAWTSGLFWLEALGWVILLYMLTYLIIGWINRYPILGYVIVVSLVAVIIHRIVLAV